MCKEKVGRFYFTKEEVEFLKKVIEQAYREMPASDLFYDVMFGEYMKYCETIAEELNTGRRWGYP